MPSLWILLCPLALLLGVRYLTHRRLARLRRAGLYPATGQATLADVERLQRAGLTPWAMRCYREIHRCSLRQARHAVESLAVDS